MNASTEPFFDVQSLLEPLSGRLGLAVTAAIVIGAALMLQSVFEEAPFPEIPSVGKGSEAARRKEFLSGGAHRLYAEGYRKFKDGVFRITTARESPVIVIAPQFLQELQKLPEEVLSRRAATNELMQSEYIKLQGAPEDFHLITKGFVNPNLAQLTPVVSETLDQALVTEIPQSSDERIPLKVNKLFLRLTAIASGRVFVGPKLCRDEKYIDNSINFTTDVMMAVASVAMMPVWLRPVLSPIVPFVRALKRRIQGEKDLLQPIVNARREQSLSTAPSLKPNDLLEWFIDDQEEAGISDDMDIVHKQMVTSFAAVHTSSQTMTNMFYTLAAHPEMVDLLLGEVRDVLSKHDGKFTVQSLQEMKKMDSFMTETMRFYPLMAASGQRKVLKPFALSTGQLIPAGAIVECAQHAICYDPDIFESPEVFDPLRFYKIRQGGEEPRDIADSPIVANKANSQFVSVGPLSLWWGFGKHACTGRFFAANMIKMVTAKVLMQYEVGLPEGVTERYENVTYGDITMPDAAKDIMFKKR